MHDYLQGEETEPGTQRRVHMLRSWQSIGSAVAVAVVVVVVMALAVVVVVIAVIVMVVVAKVVVVVVDSLHLALLRQCLPPTWDVPAFWKLHTQEKHPLNRHLCSDVIYPNAASRSLIAWLFPHLMRLLMGIDFIRMVIYASIVFSLFLIIAFYHYLVNIQMLCSIEEATISLRQLWVRSCYSQEEVGWNRRNRQGISLLIQSLHVHQNVYKWMNN